MEKKAEIAETPYTVVQLGVWRVLIAKSNLKLPRIHPWKDVSSVLQLLYVFMLEIYRLSPGLFIGIMLTKLSSGVESSLTLYASSRLLTIIEIALTNGKAEGVAILNAVVMHVTCMTIIYAMQWWGTRIEQLMEHRVKYHFEGILLRANLAKDLPTSQENSNKTNASAEDAWRSFLQIIDVSKGIISTAGQLFFIAQWSRGDYGGPIFGALCLAQQVMEMYLRKHLWTQDYVVHSNNDEYIRLRALKELADEAYRKEVISDNVVGYVTEEYAKARKALGDIASLSPEDQYSLHDTPFWKIISGVASELPLIYYAFNALLYPGKFSVASMAILQQTSTSLQWTLYCILYDGNQLPKEISKVKKIYEALDVKNQVADGDLTYPGENSEESGMSLELRNIKFDYPGSKSTKSALNDVSLHIKAGHIVVIVGANGSGKSTIIKLINRLYNPTSGEILVDGQPMNSYQISNMRQATADLNQDHSLYPLSIRENIGLGYPAHVSDLDMIKRAAKLGGSYNFIEKLEAGFDTTLQPVRTAYMGYMSRDGFSPLKDAFDKLEKRVEVSGGEKQRLVASRTFMRLQSEKIKLVTVDEPSSALDPQAELDLFNRLREARNGRTMIFVTHRFGHLTKYADSIICMKDGVLAEMGNHDELMQKNGEYANLYKVQSAAFNPSESKVEPTINA